MACLWCVSCAAAGLREEPRNEQGLGDRLLSAAARGDATAARAALDDGASANHCVLSDGLTPLMMACLRGHSETAALVVSARGR